MSQRSETIVLLLALVIMGVLAISGLWWFAQSFKINVGGSPKENVSETNAKPVAAQKAGLVPIR